VAAPALDRSLTGPLEPIRREGETEFERQAGVGDVGHRCYAPIPRLTGRE
jgi:hypothetical protein